MAGNGSDKAPSAEMNLALLIKLLRMTTSTNDAEALLFMRKANTQLAAAGWDWEKLLLGKVKIVADPFSTLTRPAAANVDLTPRPPTPPPTPRTPPPWSKPIFSAPQRPAAPPPPPPPTPSYTSIPNRYAGNCWNCGTIVATLDGFAFRNPNNSSKWDVACRTCDNMFSRGVRIKARRAPKQSATIDDLAKF